MRMIAAALLAVWLTGCGRSGPGHPTAPAGATTIVEALAVPDWSTTEPRLPDSTGLARRSAVPDTSSSTTPIWDSGTVARRSVARRFPVPALPTDLATRADPVGRPTILHDGTDGHFEGSPSTDERVAIAWAVEFFTYRADEPTGNRHRRLSTLTDNTTITERSPNLRNARMFDVVAMWPTDVHVTEQSSSSVTVEVSTDWASAHELGTTSQTFRCVVEVVDGRIVRFDVLP